MRDTKKVGFDTLPKDTLQRPILYVPQRFFTVPADVATPNGAHLSTSVSRLQ